MEFALDKSTRQIWALKRAHPGVGFKQLRTPLTQYATDPLNHIHYGLDNGAYTAFDAPTFERMARAASQDLLCDWIVMPDMVGDAASTSSLFFHWIDRLDLEDKRAYVLQDGADFDLVPWAYIECVFVGGSDRFKESSMC